METFQPQIGIIGVGIGGASAAHFLTQLFPNASMDIYEAGAKVGGRIASLELGGQLYESGGSLILDKNKYVVDFQKKFGLKKRKKAKSGASFAVYRPEDSKLIYKPWQFIGHWLNALRFIWACGVINFIKLTFVVKSVIGKFDQIYRLQEKEMKSYETVEEMLGALDLLDVAQMTLKEYLSQKAGVTDDIVSKLVLPAIKSYYGQGLEVTAFLGMISLAAGMGGKLWAVHNGNSLVVESLVKNVLQSNLNARLYLSTRVASITQSANQNGRPQFKVQILNSNVSKVYDIILLAIPLHTNFQSAGGIEFRGIIPDPYENAPTKYHQLVVYHCDGRYYKPNSVKFGPIYETLFNSNLFCNGIWSTEKLQVKETQSSKAETRQSKPSPDFNAIKFIRPINFGEGEMTEQSSVWKISANAQLTKHHLENELLEKINTSLNSSEFIDAIKITEWLSYPEYGELRKTSKLEPKKEIRYPSFILSANASVGGGGLYHVNAIEWAASAMEMSVIGAKNAALLAYSKWNESLRI